MPRPAKRIQFTKAELEIIADMIGIADAGPWGEGDYQNWDEKREAQFESLRRKVQELLDRK